MKHFEKWWKEINSHPHCSLPQHKWQAEVLWRAAVSWVKQDCIYTEEDGHECIDQEMIDGELEDG